MPQPAQTILEDFAPNRPLNWYIINDGVMGGISESKIEILPEGIGKFSGTVSLENNGGFASTRARIAQPLQTNATQVLIKVKGDGKKYSFRIRTDGNFDGVS